MSKRKIFVIVAGLLVVVVLTNWGRIRYTVWHSIGAQRSCFESPLVKRFAKLSGIDDCAMGTYIDENCRGVWNFPQNQNNHVDLVYKLAICKSRKQHVFFAEYGIYDKNIEVLDFGNPNIQVHVDLSLFETILREGIPLEKQVKIDSVAKAVGWEPTMNTTFFEKPTVILQYEDL